MGYLKQKGAKDAKARFVSASLSFVVVIINDN